MKNVSERFLAELGQSHRLATEATLLVGGVAAAPLPLVDGSVTLQADAANRARASLVFEGADLVPILATDPLAPWGNEVRLRQGVVIDGKIEWVTLGVFGIESTKVDDSGDRVAISCECADRAARISRARIERVVNVAKDTPLVALIEQLLADAWPEVEFVADDLPWTTPKGVIDEQADPWEEAQKRALECGAQLFFDAEGVARLVAARSDAPVARYVEGTDGLLISASVELGRENVYNRWIARGESAEASVRGVATDDDPNSPTFYGGPFGRVPKFYESQFIRTVSQAIAAAEEMKARERGLRRVVTFGGVSNPALEPDDVIHIRRPQLGIDAEFVIDELTIPLNPANEGMSAKCREQVVF